MSLAQSSPKSNEIEYSKKKMFLYLNVLIFFGGNKYIG